MMVHPAPYESATMPCLAVRHFDVRYSGRSAHASAYPEMGINAADALTVSQVAIGLLRQHIRPTDRIHGIVTDGGDAPNIVPERAAGQWYVRAKNLVELDELYPKVQRCFEAGALATGAGVHFDEPSPTYSEFVHDADLVDLWIAEAGILGRTMSDQGVAGSTDMANVSLAMPTIHPMLAIEAGGAANHQPAFTAACINASADQAVRDGALGMARTAVAAAQHEGVRERLLATRYITDGR
jgi:metal-dependent amidase/aminoacylase/carboxypeptidase family protein